MKSHTFLSVTSLCKSNSDVTHTFPQVWFTLHCIQPSLAVIMVWLFDIPNEDSANSLVLQLHQFLSTFPILMRWWGKYLAKVLQRHIITVKVVRHGQVDVGSIELQIDLAVDGGLWALVVVLVHLWGGPSLHGGQLRRVCRTVLK